MEKEAWTQSKARRTKSWKSNPDYDNLISDFSISSLEFLEEQKPKNIKEYKKNHNLDDPKILKEYQQMKQSLKMVKDERIHRTYDLMASTKVEYWFDAESGLVMNSNGEELYTIDFSADEDKYIVRDSNGDIIDTYDEEDIHPTRRSLEEVYKDWGYINEETKRKIQQQG